MSVKAYANHLRTYRHFKSTSMKHTTGWINCIGWTQGKPSGGGQYEQKHVG